MKNEKYVQAAHGLRGNRRSVYCACGLFGHALTIDNISGKGCLWRAEGIFADDSVLDFDLAASLAPFALRPCPPPPVENIHLSWSLEP